MSEPLRPDLCIIGAGAAGLAAALRAASFGVPVVLVEQGRMGGRALHAGGVAAKAVMAAARRAHEARTGTAFGLGWIEPRVDFERLRHHVGATIAALAPNATAERLTGLGVTVIRGEAAFTGRGRLEAAGAVIEARRFVIATGSQPIRPDIPGLDGAPHLTTDTIFDLAHRPDRLIVLGTGPAAVELAQAYRRLGVAVVLVGAGGLLPDEDPEAVAVIERVLVAEGVELRLHAQVERIERRGSRVAALLAGKDGAETLSASHLLVAAGRRAVTAGLGLEAAGVALDADGIRVGARLRTTNRRIYAIGDCAGGGGGRGGAGPHSVHLAEYQAGIVVRRILFRLPLRVRAETVPRVIYTDPEIAAVGLGEEEARGKRGAMRILRWPLVENASAQAERSSCGHIKVFATPGGRILGCVIVAPGAADLIGPWTLAMAKGLKVHDIERLVVPSPAVSEVSTRAAAEFSRLSARRNWVRRLIGWVRLWG